VETFYPSGLPRTGCNGAPVEKVWMTGAKAVDKPPARIFFPPDPHLVRPVTACGRAFVIRFA